MKRADLDIHAAIMTRALERHKASPAANPIVIQVLTSLVEEYTTAHEIVDLEPDDVQS